MHTHEKLGAACELLGLPTPPPPDEGTKRQRVAKSFAALPDARLPEVARRILRHQQLDARTRNAIEDVLWAAEDTPEIPKRTRHEIARDLDLEDLVHGANRFIALLDRLWVLEDDPFGSLFFNTGASLRGQIDRHVFRNPGDWSAWDLFENLGAFEASDRRFALFLEGLTSADVVPDEPAQRHIVNRVNPRLRAVGVELRETGTDGGYPVFAVVSTRSESDRRLGSDDVAGTGGHASGRAAPADAARSHPMVGRVFLCHSSGDKEHVRDLYRRLQRDGFTPWLDEEDILPGQGWEREIRRAIRASRCVLVCLSKSSVTKSA
jgi:hypothetical protein